MKPIAFFLFFNLLFFNALAQSQLLFQEEKNGMAVFSYNQSNRTVDQMLEKLADGTRRPINQAEFSLLYTQYCSIHKENNNRLRLAAKLQSINFQGLTTYHGFSMEDVMLPQSVDFTYKWYDHKANLIESQATSKHFNGMPPLQLINITEIDTFVYRLRPPRDGSSRQQNTTAEPFSLELTDIQYNYTSQSLQAFLQKTNLVDNYLNISETLTTKVNSLNTINLELLDSLTAYQQQVNSNLRWIDWANNQDAIKELPLNRNDPAYFIQKVTDFEKDNNEMQVQINGMLQHLHQLYYDKGMLALSRNQLSEAEHFFNKSIEHSPRFAQAHFQLANIDYRRNELEQASEHIVQIMKRLSPDRDTKTLCINLANQILTDYTTNAAAFNNTRQYDLALQNLEAAKTFCNELLEVHCNQNIEREYRTAIQGQYNTILSDGERALAGRRLAEAETFLVEAKAFRTRNMSYLPNRQRLVDLAFNIMRSILESGNLALFDANLTAANTAIRDAEIFQQRHRDLLPTPNEIAHATMAMYRNCAANGQDAIRNQQVNQAITYLQLAQEFQRANARYIGNQNDLQPLASSIFDWMMQKARESLSNQNFAIAEEFTNDAELFWQENSHLIPSATELNLIRNSIYNGYLDNAKALNASSNFSEALQIIDNARQLCQRYNAVTCDSQLNATEKQAHTGIYRQLIAEARTAYQSNRIDQAEELLSEATDYQINHNLSVDNSITRLTTQVKQKKYNNLLDEGRQLLNSNRYQQALERFDEAQRTEQQFDVTPKAELPALITKSARLLALDEIKSSNSYVASNRLNEARTHFNTAKDLQNTYNLHSDTEINTQLNSLQQSIQGQACINLENEYNRLLDNANQLIDNKKFRDANQQLSETINLLKNDAMECNLSYRNAQNRQNEIAPVINYLNQQDAIEQQIAEGRYDSAIESYKQSTSFFNQNNLLQWNLNHATLFDYMLESNSHFINFGTGYFINEGAYNKALSLLRELAERGIHRKTTRSYQTLLGQELARYDYAANPSGNWRTNVEVYTNGNNWFKYLKKAYKKQWKSF